MEDYKNQDEIFSNKVRAGKRTYFFDVRATRNDDYYLTITESKKFFNEDGTSHYKKHKIFLYKEDFEKFKDGLNDVVEKVISLNNGESSTQEGDALESKSFKDVEFEDLD